VHGNALTSEDLEWTRGRERCGREAIEKAVKPAKIFDDKRRACVKRLGVMTSEYGLCSTFELASPQPRIPRGHGRVLEGSGNAIQRGQHNTILADIFDAVAFADLQIDIHVVVAEETAQVDEGRRLDTLAVANPFGHPFLRSEFRV
jgi:hypothetical protein